MTLGSAYKDGSLSTVISDEVSCSTGSGLNVFEVKLSNERKEKNETKKVTAPMASKVDLTRDCLRYEGLEFEFFGVS